MSLKDEWDLESALRILQHPTVDAQIWAEVVEWILKYGPPSLKKILLDASLVATETQFPELKPARYTPDGQPIYDIENLAKVLNMTEEEVVEILNGKEAAEEPFDLFDTGSKTVH